MGERENEKDIRERSCLLRCSLLLNARAQNWHLYFLSGTSEVFREAGVDEAEVGRTATLAPGMMNVFLSRWSGLRGWARKTWMPTTTLATKKTTALGSLIE